MCPANFPTSKEEETADKNKGRPIKKPILILLNKSDIPGAMDADEFCTMKETVAIHQEFNHFVIRVFETMVSPAKVFPSLFFCDDDWGNLNGIKSIDWF